MRDREGWMNRAVDPVLDLLAESGISLSGPTIQHNLELRMSDPPSRSTIYNALEDLEDHGYIESTGGRTEHYRITDHGVAYRESEV